MGRFTEYSVVGRKLPSEADPSPKLYRMRIFAPNDVVAKSRFWYYLRQLKKVKKASGEIVGLNVISEKRPLKVKNFAIWLRYDSRSGTHNVSSTPTIRPPPLSDYLPLQMVKEFRALSRAEAVEAMYQNMAAQHRARFRNVQILRVAEIAKKDDVRRPYIKQLLDPKLKFPLPHRRTKSKAWYAANRPATWA
ncbi:putative 60s ribosomal protein l20 [Kockovaella imperatae]|uniref:60S ribosomal protein L20 n=1 Tax=Kockovaella imperatae TaxID=4999 RepID=A0A1Y1U7I4_9TREE|nr:putative 60s ribosomal protein l20 [Kockovaella imperatae]ORX33968.1 putative 60s ribosomal protein l20 [Kockovaella imperatae]